MARSVWSAEGVGQRQRGSFSEQGRAESGDEAGCTTPVGSRRFSMDERYSRKDESRNTKDGKGDDQRARACFIGVDNGGTCNPVGAQHTYAMEIWHDAVPRDDGTRAADGHCGIGGGTGGNGK